MLTSRVNLPRAKGGPQSVRAYYSNSSHLLDILDPVQRDRESIEVPRASLAGAYLNGELPLVQRGLSPHEFFLRGAAVLNFSLCSFSRAGGRAGRFVFVPLNLDGFMTLRKIVGRELDRLRRRFIFVPPNLLGGSNLFTALFPMFTVGQSLRLAIGGQHQRSKSSNLSGGCKQRKGFTINDRSLRFTGVEQESLHRQRSQSSFYRRGSLAGT